MNTNYIIVLIFVLWFSIPFILEKFFRDEFSSFLEKHKIAINGIQILGTLGVIISIGLTVYQFNSSEDIRLSEIENTKLTKLKTLEFEIELNSSVLENEVQKVFINKTGNHISIPESRFTFDILSSNINSGFFVDDKSFDFINSLRIMKMCNSLMDQSLKILNYEHLVDPRNNLLKNGQRSKINQLMKEVEKNIPVLRKLLCKTNNSIEKMISQLE